MAKPNPFAAAAAGNTAVAEPEPTAAAPAEAPAKRGPDRPPKAAPEPAEQFNTVDDSGKVAAPSGDPFSAPSGLSDVTIPDMIDELLLVRPTEYIESMTTKAGTGDAVRAHIVRLEGKDGSEPGELCENVLIFQTALKREAKAILDGLQRGGNPYLLARLEMGAGQAGKNKPYIFSKPDEDDITLARQYLAAQKG